MSNLRFLCKYVVRVTWRLLQITHTIITTTKALLANIRHKIVLLNVGRTVGKLHMLLHPTASMDRAQMANFRGGAHTVEMEGDVDKL
jgi:hypothetical protein